MCLFACLHVCGFVLFLFCARVSSLFFSLFISGKASSALFRHHQRRSPSTVLLPLRHRLPVAYLCSTRGSVRRRPGSVGERYRGLAKGLRRRGKTQSAHRREWSVSAVRVPPQRLRLRCALPLAHPHSPILSPVPLAREFQSLRAFPTDRSRQARCACSSLALEGKN